MYQGYREHKLHQEYHSHSPDLSSILEYLTPPPHSYPRKKNHREEADEK